MFAAPGAAGVLDRADELLTSCVLFVAFCLVSSGTYLWNDVLDAEVDRAHPRKRGRPVAAGDVPATTAGVVGTVAIAAGLALSAATGRWQTVAVVGLYVAVTAAYSLVLKRIAVVDLVALAAGFVLRAAAGAVAVDVAMSSWFVLCTSFGSLFIAAGKRLGELHELGARAAEARPTLADYDRSYLRLVLAATSGATIVSYCAWALETSEVAGLDLPWYEATIVPVVTAVLRYALVVERGGGAAPEEVFARDRVVQTMGALWIVLYGIAVYG